MRILGFVFAVVVAMGTVVVVRNAAQVYEDTLQQVQEKAYGH